MTEEKLLGQKVDEVLAGPVDSQTKEVINTLIDIIRCSSVTIDEYLRLCGYEEL